MKGMNMCSRILLLIFVGLFLTMLIGCEGEENLPSEAKTLLDELNGWDSEALDIIECPDLHPGYADLGETRGWILTHKEELRKLGFNARWDHAKMMYEVVSEEQAPSALCGSQPISVTPTTSLQGD
jgi:hypothetical protein